MSSTAECHLLPCDIEYGGNAPVHIYFRPTAVEGASSDEAAAKQSESGGGNNKTETAATNADADNTSTGTSSQDSAGVLAAQLRGRGLLCLQPTALPTSVVGTVVSTDNATRMAGGAAQGSGGGGGVELVGGTFTSIHEWHHEHDVRSLKRAELKGSGVAGRTVEWMEVARSVHDPIE
uniref:Uncharacterized protein n=1 Tax=Minutocellus polymorphus TaxID=265543 RepID=A0A6U0LL16_9STRA